VAFLTCNAFSESLGMGVTLDVVLPQATQTQIGVNAAVTPGDLPVLYLLHGLSDDHSAWMRYTSIERYAAEAGLAVVMPAVGRSFYANEAHGHRYWDYVSEELPKLVGDFFRVSTRPQDTFVAGLSMGGYGAMRLALTHPGRFAAAASLSGGLDIVAVSELPERSEELERIFGGRPGPDGDLFALLPRTAPEDLPALYVGCGTDDPRLVWSTRFIELAQGHGATVTTDFRPGDHEWAVWDAMIRDVIDWLPREG
jgi:putative tributyrin esterase